MKEYKKRKLLNPKDFTDKQIQESHEQELKLLKEIGIEFKKVGKVKTNTHII